MLWVYLWIACGPLAGAVGAFKGQRFGLHCLLGVFGGPLWLIYVLFLTPAQLEAQRVKAIARQAEVQQQRLDGRRRLEEQRAADERRFSLPISDQPPIKPIGIVPLRGETFFFECAARHGQVVQTSSFERDSGGLSIRLGHGMRAYGGNSRGHWVKHRNFQWDSTGRVNLSDARICFKGTNGIVSIPYDEILGFDVDGKVLAVTTRTIGVQTFLAVDDRLGRFFQKVIDERATVAQTPS